MCAVASPSGEGGEGAARGPEAESTETRARGSCRHRSRARARRQRRRGDRPGVVSPDVRRVPRARPARGDRGRPPGATRAAEATRDARPSRLSPEHARPGIAPRRRPVGRQPTRLGREPRAGLRLGSSQGARQGGDRDAGRRVRPPRRVGSPRSPAVRGARARRKPRARAGRPRRGVDRPPRRARRCGAGRRSPTSPTSRSSTRSRVASRSSGCSPSSAGSRPISPSDATRTSSASSSDWWPTTHCGNGRAAFR